MIIIILCIYMLSGFYLLGRGGGGGFPKKAHLPKPPNTSDNYSSTPK